jgi:thiosulfate dehydrogenase [quinone] large subunit
MSALLNRKNQIVQYPPMARFLFADTRASWLWLLVRLWVGYKWIDASMHKISNPAWTQTGEAIKGYWLNAVAIPDGGKPAISFDWYRSFLQFLIDTDAARFMGPLIAYGEFLIGVALILGIFTGIAAFFGGFMNWNFMMAGSASTNPVLFALAVGLVLAWKVAGYIGVDHYLLPMLGTPWRTKTVEVDVQPLVPVPSQA